MVYDFDEIKKTIEETVERLLKTCQVKSPPVDPNKIAKKTGFVYTEMDIAGRRGQAWQSKGRKYIDVDKNSRAERKNFTLAHEILEHELPKEIIDKRERHKIALFGAPYLLMPTTWFAPACQQTSFDISKLKKIFATVSYEAIALRTLNFSEAVITVYDNGKVTNRQSSCSFFVSKRLTDEEKQVINEVLKTGKFSQRILDAGEIRAYPVFEGKFKRVILRTVFD